MIIVLFFKYYTSNFSEGEGPRIKWSSIVNLEIETITTLKQTEISWNLV